MATTKQHPASGTWEIVRRMAKEAGAKYPECVAAQWAIESNWGKAAPGENYFGLKSAAPGTGQGHKTMEERDGVFVEEIHEFMTFKSLEECVEYLVKLWYKDYKEYKGCNNAPDRNAAAHMLQEQGYATDSQYAEKLIKVMNEMEPAAPVKKPAAVAKPPEGDAKAAGGKALFTLVARQPTWLKKTRQDADALGEKDRVAVPKGKTFGVTELREVAGDAHAHVELAGGAGQWFIFEPHWEKHQATGEALPSSVDWSDFGCLVTPHLTVGEVLQYDSRRAPRKGSKDEARILETAKHFEKIRQAWGKPLAVTSWYRPEPINQQVGGVPGSRHVTGEAFDVYPTTTSVDAFYQWIKQRWTGGLGDGRAKGFIHLDTRNNGHFVPGAGVRPITEWDY